MNKTQKITYYILLILVSLLFVVAAVPKLLDNPMSQAGFTMAHLPIWFMYFIGVAELAGVIGLWIRSLQKLASYGLSIILIGAIVTTAIFQSALVALFPLLVLIMLIYVVKLGKKRT